MNHHHHLLRHDPNHCHLKRHHRRHPFPTVVDSFSVDCTVDAMMMTMVAVVVVEVARVSPILQTVFVVVVQMLDRNQCQCTNCVRPP